MINNLTRTDIERLLDEYEQCYYKGTDFKEKARRRILDGATYKELNFGEEIPNRKLLSAFQLELRNFSNWAWNKLNEMKE